MSLAPLTDEQFTQLKSITEHGIPFIERTGLQLLDLRPGYAKLLIPLAPNVNHIGTMYAGALFTLAELPGGVLFLASFDMSRFYPVVSEMNIRFRRPATTDITVEATLGADEVERITQEAERDGKSVFVLEQELKDAQGNVVAIAHGTYQARRIG